MMMHRVLAGVTATVLAAGLLAVEVTPVSATTVSVATEAEYRNALTALSGDNSGPHVIEVTADITIAGATDPAYAGTQPLTINGNGHTINGDNNSRVLFFNSSALVTMNDLTVTGGTQAGDGGGVVALGAVTVDNSAFTANTSTGTSALGGAINAAGAVSVTNSSFVGNSATASSGGIAFGGAIRSPLLVTVTNSSFSANTAIAPGGFGGAGAISTLAGVTATNSTFTGNTAGNIGGAIAVGDGPSTFVYVTLASNAAPTGAQVLIDDGAEILPFGTVFADPLGGGANCVQFGVASSGYNYATDDSCGLTGTGDTQDGADPQLQPIGAYGGTTQTRPPAVTSPLVDAIPSAACDPTVTTDQRGLPRPADGNDDGTNGCDIGAVELQPTPPPASPASPAGRVVGPVAARPTFTG
jgi:hypothetical protein